MSDFNPTAHEQNRFDAERDFEKILFKSFFIKLLSRFKDSPATLLSLDDIRKRFHLHKEHYHGLQTVEIDKISGSEGRYSEFDRHFLPMSAKSRQKWIAINSAVRDNINLPPVQLYKVDDVYFVRDGNHRISVAKALGQKYIEAEVTEIETPVKVRKGMDRKKILLKQEYTNFLEVTGLKGHVGKEDEIELTELGGYDIILEHIRMQKYILEKDLGKKVPYREAARSWYDDLFKQFVHVNFIYDITAYFPGRTAGDIYIWILNNKKFLVEEFGVPMDIQSAVKALMKKYAGKRKDEIDKLVKHIRESRDNDTDKNAEFRDQGNVKNLKAENKKYRIKDP